MKIGVTYHLPDGVGLYPTAGEDGELSRCKVDVCIDGLQMESARRVLAELSEVVVKDFARLSALSCFKSNDASLDKETESSLVEYCSVGSACDGAVLSDRVNPLSSQPM